MDPKGLARYGAVLRLPHVLGLELSASLARLPLGMTGLALVLFLRQEGYSYAIAGSSAAAWGLGTALGGPVQGRLIDRLGAARVLVPGALINAAGLIGALPLAFTGAPGGLLLLTALVAGLGTPPLSPVVRSLWGGLVPAELRQTAFALDAVVVEVQFILGPLLVAALAATVGEAIAVVLAALLVLAGILAFVLQPPARARPGAVEHVGWLGPLRAPGLVTVVLATIPLGACIGCLEIALPAFAEEHGNRDWAGVLLATWSVASGTAGLIYGARSAVGSPARSWTWLAVLAPLAFAPALLAGGIASMALLLIPAGVVIAPALTMGTQVVEQVVPTEMLTEAYGWAISSLVFGLSMGHAMSGAISDGPGWSVAVATGVGLGLLGGVAALVRRETLRPRAAAV